MIRTKTLRRLGLLILMASPSFAQDPLKVAPQSYKLDVENEWVKVTRVHYPAHTNIPPHDHTETDAAYVYLNDSGPVIFRHIGLDYGAITRAETKAGSFRLYRAVKEVHAVENPGDTPSDFLRVEFKTVPDKTKPLRGKFYREPYSATENFAKVQFENEQIRVTRLTCARGQACVVSPTTTEPFLILSLSSAKLESSRGRGQLSVEPGTTRWSPAGHTETFKNLVEQPAELLRFDFKTRPMSRKD